MSSQIAPRSTDSFFKPKRTFAKRSPNGFPIGPRTKARAAANRDMNKQGIDFCEVRIPGVCVGRIMLTWMHDRKSRFILTAKDWRTACRACLPCHDYGEHRGHKFMKQIVLNAIKSRKTRS